MPDLQIDFMYTNKPFLKLYHVCFKLLRKHNLYYKNDYNFYSSTKFQTEPTIEWNVAIKEAENVMGYPASFLNLRWLLNDEIANVAMNIRKLVGTEHPLIGTIKNIVLSTNSPIWGLVVLLISRAAGEFTKFKDIECDRTAGILRSQRVLAEVTEMMHTSILIHKSILNIDPNKYDLQDLNYGNKIALLSGDYLLSKCFRDIARIMHHDLAELMGSALRDLSEGQFLGQRDSQNLPLPSKPSRSTSPSLLNDESIDYGPYKINEILGNSKEEWILRSLLEGSNLLAKSCKGALLLGGHEEHLQCQAYLFGKYLALAWNAKLDYEQFVSYKGDSINLTSAPIMLHLVRDASLYDKIIKGIHNTEHCDFQKIFEVVHGGSALQETQEMQAEFADKALQILNTFENNDARFALANVINAM